MVYYCVHKSPPLVPVLMKPACTFTRCLLNILPRFPKQFPSWKMLLKLKDINFISNVHTATCIKLQQILSMKMRLSREWVQMSHVFPFSNRAVHCKLTVQHRVKSKTCCKNDPLCRSPAVANTFSFFKVLSNQHEVFRFQCELRIEKYVELSNSGLF
jgi:hypothetical protein